MKFQGIFGDYFSGKTSEKTTREAESFDMTETCIGGWDVRVMHSKHNLKYVGKKEQ